MKVSIVYAQSSYDQFEQALDVDVGASIADVITQSSLLQHYPTLDITQASVGVFAKRLSLNAIVKNGDRIEIYRPLLVDPKKARRLRALKQAAKR